MKTETKKSKTKTKNEKLKHARNATRSRSYTALQSWSALHNGIYRQTSSQLADFIFFDCDKYLKLKLRNISKTKIKTKKKQ